MRNHTITYINIINIHEKIIQSFLKPPYFHFIISAGNCCILLAISLLSFHILSQSESLNSKWHLHCVFLFLHCISILMMVIERIGVLLMS